MDQVNSHFLVSQKKDQLGIGTLREYLQSLSASLADTQIEDELLVVKKAFGAVDPSWHVTH